MKKVIIIALIGILSIFSPIIAYADVESIYDPVPDLNNYTLDEVFTNTINDLGQYKITSILDLQIYEGLSLRDIFEDNQWLQDMLLGNNVILPNTTEDILRYDNGAYVLDRYVQELTLTSAMIISLSTSLYTNIDVVSIAVGSTFTNWIYNGVGVASRTQSTTLYSGFVDYFAIPSTYDNVENVNKNLVQFTNSNILSLAVAKGTYASLAEAQADLAGTKLWYQLATPLLAVETTGPIFTTDPSQLQLDEWLSFYLDPSTIASFDMVGDIQVYKVGNTLYNLTEMINDKIYSTFNLDTFDNLTEGEQELQFNQWSFRDIENEKVLSFSYFSSLFPLLTLADMITWYNVYLNLIDVDDLARNTIDDTEKTILIIALILYAIGIFIALYTKNKIVFVGSSLLWFIPIVIIPNLFIIVFSSIMFIASILIVYYPNKESDFE